MIDKSQEALIKSQRNLRERLEELEGDLKELRTDFSHTWRAAAVSAGVCLAYFIASGPMSAEQSDYHTVCLGDSDSGRSAVAMGMALLAALALMLRCLYILGENTRLMAEHIRCSTQFNSNKELFDRPGALTESPNGLNPN